MAWVMAPACSRVLECGGALWCCLGAYGAHSRGWELGSSSDNGPVAASPTQYILGYLTRMTALQHRGRSKQ
ncbi:uncharacterized protein BDZ83DRAFT_597824 [Colletotrichum acutatum]|uniref:Uncharacterized protein n=1 Tax=Glomerella acutata TaxID=27357 RepID=A0AAD8XQ75_GLOAC|nr:uncharacterized protein BDZ83DRAFT_597824 [Colletotrichum acutatum]KAK1731535.1 hypothetical protein BDZ83DRAFT_597824 [Colletotrichum acutatum]